MAIDPANAAKAARAIREFGFDLPEVTPELLQVLEKIVRMGNPPVRIEVMTSISGVEFNACYRERQIDLIDGVQVNLIRLDHLKANKKAVGRYKDLSDLGYLP